MCSIEISSWSRKKITFVRVTFTGKERLCEIRRSVQGSVQPIRSTDVHQQDEERCSDFFQIFKFFLRNFYRTCAAVSACDCSASYLNEIRQYCSSGRFRISFVFRVSLDNPSPNALLAGILQRFPRISARKSFRSPFKIVGSHRAAHPTAALLSATEAPHTTRTTYPTTPIAHTLLLLLP